MMRQQKSSHRGAGHWVGLRGGRPNKEIPCPFGSLLQGPSSCISDANGRGGWRRGEEGRNAQEADVQVLRIPDIAATTGSWEHRAHRQSRLESAYLEGSSGPAAALDIPFHSHQWALYWEYESQQMACLEKGNTLEREHTLGWRGFPVAVLII